MLVTAALLRRNGKILIAKRSAEKTLGGFWEFPGGKVETGEKEEECLTREIKEELGVDIQVIGFFMENYHSYNDLRIHLKSYFCELISEGIFSCNDHEKIEWVDVNELGNFQLAPADIPIAKALNERNLF